MYLTAVKNRLETTSKVFSVLLAFLIPISTSLTYVALFGLILSWLLAGNFQEKSKIISTHPVARAAFLLFGLFVLGAFYANTEQGHIKEMLEKMGKLLFIPFVLPLMVEKKWREFALWAFTLAMVLTLVLSISKVYMGLPIHSRFTVACVFKDHIYTNLMMSFTTFLIAHYAMDQTQWWRRTSAWLLVLGLSYYVFFMSEGRAGYLIFGALWVLFCYQRLARRYFYYGIFGLCLLIGVVCIGSPRFQERVNLLTHNIALYQAGDAGSSLGQRVQYATETFVLALERPWFGWGTGSFKEVYGLHAKELGLQMAHNPHNEYLNTFFQLGMMGVLGLLLLFWTILKTSWRLPTKERWLAQGLLCAMGLGCVINSWIMDFTSGYFFVTLIAICFGALRVKGAQNATAPH